MQKLMSTLFGDSFSLDIRYKQENENRLSNFNFSLNRLTTLIRKHTEKPLDLSARLDEIKCRAKLPEFEEMRNIIKLAINNARNANRVLMAFDVEREESPMRPYRLFKALVTPPRNEENVVTKYRFQSLPSMQTHHRFVPNMNVSSDSSKDFTELISDVTVTLEKLSSELKETAAKKTPFKDTQTLVIAIFI